MRYVNPDDGDGRLNSQYYGTVQIAGVTGDNTPQSLKHWVGSPFIIMNAGHLALGYVDDGLGDKAPTTAQTTNVLARPGPAWISL